MDLTNPLMSANDHVDDLLESDLVFKIYNLDVVHIRTSANAIIEVYAYKFL